MNDRRVLSVARTTCGSDSHAPTKERTISIKYRGPQQSAVEPARGVPYSLERNVSNCWYCRMRSPCAMCNSAPPQGHAVATKVIARRA